MSEDGDTGTPTDETDQSRTDGDQDRSWLDQQNLEQKRQELRDLLTELRQISEWTPEAEEKLRQAAYLAGFFSVLEAGRGGSGGELPTPDLPFKINSQDVYAGLVQYLRFDPPNGDAIHAEVVKGMLAAADVRRQDGQFYAPDPPKQNQAQAKDPVLLGTGQLTDTDDDLYLDGAGIAFVFARFYRSGTESTGPLGPQWTHNHDITLRDFGSKVAVTTADLREEIYTHHPDYDYWQPPDGQHAVVLPTDSSFVLRTPDGLTYTFEAVPDNVTLHRLAVAADRFGNALRYSYAGERVARVTVNHPDRYADFGHDDDGRLRTVTDHTGRTWRYGYDEEGRLAVVTTPATAQYPAGLSTWYEYAEAAGLPTALVRVADPAGRVYLENDFADSPGLVEHGRVVTQIAGDGTTLLGYENVVEQFDDDEYDETQRPVTQTNLVRADGSALHYLLNATGNVLVKEERVVDGHQFRWIRTRYRYNVDGALVAVLSPEGTLTQYYLGREHFTRTRAITDADVPGHPELTPTGRLGFGQVLATVTRARRYTFAEATGVRPWGLLGPDVLDVGPDDIVVKATFEPAFGQPLTVSDPRYTASPDPDHRESPDYERTLTRFAYDGPTALLASITHPTPTGPDGEPGGAVVESYGPYDGAGRLLATVDPTGLRYAFEYSSTGYRRAMTADPDGLAVRTGFDLDALGRTAAVHHPRGPVTRYTYNELDQLVETVAPTGQTSRFGYDVNGQLTRVVRDARDENGVDLPGAPEVTEYLFDEYTRLVRQSETGLVSHHRYDANGNPTLTVHPDGARIRRRFDSAGRLIALTTAFGTPEEATTLVRYDDEGRLIATTDPLGNVGSVVRDAFGRVVAELDPLGTVIARDFDKAGNVTSERVFDPDPAGGYRLLGRCEYTHDELGRRTSRTHNLFPDPVPAADPYQDFADGPGPGRRLTTLVFFDAADRVVRTVDPLGHEERTDYDVLGRAVRITDAVGDRVEHRYDAHGNIVRTDRHEGGEVFTELVEYDEVDRPVRLTDSAGASVGYAWDSRDNVAVITDELGHATRFVRDLAERLVRVVRADEETAYTYTPAGLVATVTDAEGRVTRREYDAARRLRRLVYPGGEAEQLDYDAAGNVRAVTLADGTVLSHTCDALGRLRAVHVGAQLFAGYDYDGLGRARSIVSSTVERRYAPDSLGRPRREELRFTDPTLGGPLVLVRDFDDAGRPIGLTYPDGRVVGFERDPVHRLVRVSEERGEIAGFDFSGDRTTAVRRGNGIATGWSYDAVGRPVEIRHGPTGGPLLRLRVGRDPAGNVVSATDGPQQTVYGYDPVDRLVSVDGAALFAYDRVGNRTSHPVNPDDQYSDLGWDARGNLADDGRRRYTYDVANRLVAVHAAGGTELARYGYDGNGLRVLEVGGGVATQLVHDGASVVAEYVGGAARAQYVYDDAERPVQLRDGDHRWWFHHDFLGSTRLLTDAAGAVVARHHYAPFGELLDPPGSATANRLLYTARRYDSVLDGYDFRLREYLPALGRFAQRDPLGTVDGTNHYAYVGNNPLRYVDPSGATRAEPQPRAERAITQDLKRDIVSFGGDSPTGQVVAGIGAGVVGLVAEPVGIVLDLVRITAGWLTDGDRFDFTKIPAASSLIEGAQNTRLSGANVSDYLGQVADKVISSASTLGLDQAGKALEKVLDPNTKPAEKGEAFADLGAALIPAAGALKVAKTASKASQLGRWARFGEPLYRTPTQARAWVGLAQAIRGRKLVSYLDDIIVMPKAKWYQSKSSLGFLRDHQVYFKELIKKHPEYFDARNLRRVLYEGRAPIVNERWLKYHPGHAGFKGDVLHHHHLGHGERALAIPSQAHVGPGWNVYNHY